MRERQRLAAAHLLVRGDQQASADVDDAFVQRLGREAAEDHRSGSRRSGCRPAWRRWPRPTWAGRSPPGRRAGCRRPSRRGQLADARQQGAVADRCHRAVVGFEDNGGALAQPAGDVPVQAIEGRIEPAVAEPAVKGAWVSSSTWVNSGAKPASRAPGAPRIPRCPVRPRRPAPGRRPCRRRWRRPRHGVLARSVPARLRRARPGLHQDRCRGRWRASCPISWCLRPGVWPPGVVA